MDKLQKVIDQLKSLKEASTEDLQKVFKRYETIGASGTEPSTKQVFLHQQNLSANVNNSELTAKDIQEYCEQCGIKYDEKYNGRVKVYRASDETVDSAGDIIRQSGWNFSRYKSNPAFMYCHDYYILPIGNSIKWQVKDNALFTWELFALSEANPWAESCFQMVDAGMLRGCSVGFVPQKVLRIDDAGERAKLGLGRWGVIFEKQTLLENSACALGCNPNALIQDDIAKAIQKGVLSKDLLKRVTNDDAENKTPESLKISIDRAFTLVSTGKVFDMVPVKTESNPEPEGGFTMLAEDWQKLLKNVNDITSKTEETVSQLTAIKTDITQLRSEIKTGGDGGNKPDTDPKPGELELIKGYFDEMITDLKSINK